MVRVASVAVLLVLFLAAGCDWTDDFERAGVQISEKGDVEGAALFLSRAYSASPDDPRARASLQEALELLKLDPKVEWCTQFGAHAACQYPSESRAVTVSKDGSLVVWDLDSRRPIQRRPEGRSYGQHRLYPAALSQSGRLAIATELGGPPTVWSVPDLRALAVLPSEFRTASMLGVSAGPAAGDIHALAVSGRTVHRWFKGTKGVAASVQLTIAPEERLVGGSVSPDALAVLVIRKGRGSSARAELVLFGERPTKRSVGDVGAGHHIVAWAPDSKRVFLANDVGAVTELAVPVRGRRKIAARKVRATALSVSPRGDVLAIGWQDGRLDLMSLERATLLRSRQLEVGAITKLAWGPTGAVLAAGSGTGRVVRLLAPALIGQSKHQGHAGGVTSLHVSAAGTVLSTGMCGRVNQLLAGEAGRLVPMRPLLKPTKLRRKYGSAYLWDVGYLGDGRTMVVVPMDGVIHYYDRACGAPLGSGPGLPDPDLMKAPYAATLVTSGSSKRLAFVHHASGIVYIRDGPEQGAPRALEPPPLANQTHEVAMVACFSADNRFLAVGYRRGSIGLWDASTGELRLTVNDLPSAPQFITLPDGLDRAIVVDAAGRIIEIDLTERKSMVRGTPHPGGKAVEAKAYASAGRILTWSRDGSLTLWSTTPLALVSRMSRKGAKEISHAAYFHEADVVVVREHGDYFVTYKASTGKMITATQIRGARSFESTPGLEILVMGFSGGEVLVLDMRGSQTILWRAKPHDTRSTRIRLSPDGDQILVTAATHAIALDIPLAVRAPQSVAHLLDQHLKVRLEGNEVVPK